MKYVIAALMLLASTFVGASNFTNNFQPGHSGFWFNPNVDGTGLSVTVDKNQVGVAFYSHDPEQASSFENEGRFLPWKTGAWFAGSAPYLLGQPEVEIELFSSNCYFGNRAWDELDPNNYGCETQAAGRLVLEVFSCSVMKVTVEIEGTDGSTFVLGEDSFGVVPVMTTLATCSNECNSIDVSPPNPACPTARLKFWPNDTTPF